MRENYEELILNAVGKWSWDRDFEDLKQELYICLMEFPDDWKDGKVVVFLRYRAIDWLRKRDRRYNLGHLKELLGLDELFDPPSKEEGLKPSVLLGLSGREAVIADLWYEGFDMEKIGKSLGISQSRVSQIVADIRKKVRRIDERDREASKPNRTTVGYGESKESSTS